MEKQDIRRVKVLRDSVARKIAAGEVIDRPFSVIRELLDNAIDAGSTEISLFIENGGMNKIRIVDNGHGMSKEDLELCYLPHATSKIESENDLLKVRSLGFRGEALSSISTCTRMEVISSQDTDQGAHKLVVHDGKVIALKKCQGKKGTVIDASDLFFSFPARKRFLKSASAESNMCRVTFIEKAIPFPEIDFKFYVDGKMRLYLPKTDLKDRIMTAYSSHLTPDFFHELTEEGQGFSIKIIASTIDISRKDRRYIQIFANNRRIDEFSLVQAAQYGYSEHLPGGNFPHVFIFIDIDPVHVDFNIHPAKKEAKFKNLPAIHHTVVRMLKRFLSEYSINLNKSRSHSITRDLFEKKDLQGNSQNRSWEVRENRSGYSPTPGFKPGSGGGASFTQAFETVRREKADSAEDFSGGASGLTFPGVKPQSTVGDNPRFVAQVMNLFLIAEWGERLFIIDQHAAHERILYERFSTRKNAVQTLLVPIALEVSPEEDKLIRGNLTDYDEMGIRLEKKEDSKWVITALPEACTDMEEDIIEFLKQEKGSRAEMERELYARMSCRLAIKDGEKVDTATAEELLRQTFELEDARCPHGRPIWFELTRGELFNLVGRT